MEMTGVNEAVQVLDVGIKGIDTALRLSGNFVGWSIKEITQLVKFIIVQSSENKNITRLKPGEMKLNELLSYNANMSVQTLIMQADEKIIPEFKEYCKANRLSYSFLYDANKADGKIEIAYSEDQENAFRTFISNWSPAVRDYSFDEYVQNATPEELAAVEEELSENIKKNIKSYYEGGEVRFSELAKMSNYMTAVTMPAEQLRTFNEQALSNDISYSILKTDEKTCTVAAVTTDLPRIRLSENTAVKQSLAEFLNENRSVVPDDMMQEAAKMGIAASGDNERIVQIDSRQITEANEYSVKVRIMDNDKASYVTVPRYQIYDSKTPGKFNLLLHKNEKMSVYESSKYTELKNGERVILNQEAKTRLPGDEIADMAASMEKVYDERGKKIKSKLSDFFVNTPEYEQENKQKQPEKEYGAEKNQIKENMTEDNIKEQIPDNVAVTYDYQAVKYNGRHDYVSISIDKEACQVEKKENYYTSRVPGTYGDDVLHISIPSRDVEESANRRAIIVKLDKNAEYSLKSENGIIKKTGKYLFEKHYEPSIYKSAETGHRVRTPDRKAAIRGRKERNVRR